MTAPTPGQTPVPGAESPVDASLGGGQGIVPDEAPKGNREARYRVERNDAREALATAQAQVEAYQTRELERVASKHLSNPADIFALSGKSLSDFLTEDGELDAELITDVANDLLGSRPGLRPTPRATDPTQGSGGIPGKRPVSWEALFVK
jgi:hypothetical protein